ncbi:MAG: hypothetical protein ACXW4Z_20740, partial [Candidatus Binatia bacterium]
IRLAAPFDGAQGEWNAKGANNFDRVGAGFKPALFLFLAFIAALVSERSHHLESALNHGNQRQR